MKRRTIYRPSKRLCAALLCALATGGCATLGPDAGVTPIQALVRPHVGAAATQGLAVQRHEADTQRAAQQVALLLQQPLSADNSVQLALLNNRGLQATLAELGIAEADWLQASRLPNPGFSFGRMNKGDERELERGLHLNLARLITWPLVQPLEQRRLDARRGAVAAEVLQLAADTRKAWVQAVAAEETLHYSVQVREAAEAGAELARRMATVGNFNKLQRAREQTFEAEAALRHAQAQAHRTATRERLIRLLGLWGEPSAALRLPARLPDLPAEPADRPDIERQAMAQRLDVQGARLAAEATARNLGLTRATRFVNVLELGLSRNSSNDSPTQTGWEIGFELPLFDSGSARLAKAEALAMQAVHRAADTAINARSEVRQAYAQYRSAWDIAQHHRQVLVPLAQTVSEENLLRYNGMLIGVFELLADARAQIGTVQAAIDATRDFWLAQADLDMALVGKPSLMPMANAAASQSAPAAEPH